MITTIYANYAGYIWMICLCAITFFAMKALKKSFTKFTAFLYSKKVFSETEKVIVNLICGLSFSISVSVLLGRLGTYLSGQTMEYKWFVFAGILATGVYLTIEKVKNAHVTALGGALIESMEASNIEITEKDASSITRKLVDQAKKYQNSLSNTHNSVLESVSAGIGGVLDISQDEFAELEQNVAELKSKGFDTSSIEQSIAAARADGHFTVSEYKNILADLKNILAKYHA